MTGAQGAGDEAVVEIRGIAAGGDGVGRLPDGRVAFVTRTAPGDRVRVSVIKDGGRWVRARPESVEVAGPDRRDPPCPLYDSCGGCQLQHLRYRAQLEAKSRIVVEALRRIGRRTADRPAVEASAREFGYRNRMSFTLRRLRGGRVVAGLHEWENPGRVLDVDGRCLLPEDSVREAWSLLREAWGPDARLLPGGGELRLTLRAVEGGTVLAVEGGREGGSAHQLLEAVPGLQAVWHRPSGGDWRLSAGNDEAYDTWFGEAVPVQAGAFLQVNREAAEAVHRSVLGELGDPRGLHVIDAYAGVSLFGRRLARHGARVTALELDEQAVEIARQEAPPGLQVLQGPVEELLADVLPADRMILNPPRAGLDALVPEILRARPVDRLVYVSCDPATLARDLERLGERYRIRRLACFDLFPQTSHVESVVTLDHSA